MGNYIGEAGWLESRWWNDKWLECQSLYLSIYLSIYCICLSICPSVRLSDLSIYLSFYLSNRSIERSIWCSLFLCLSIYMSTHPSVHLSVHLSVFLSFRPSICHTWSFCLPVFLSLYRFSYLSIIFLSYLSFLSMKAEKEAVLRDFLRVWRLQAWKRSFCARLPPKLEELQAWKQRFSARLRWKMIYEGEPRPHSSNTICSFWLACLQTTARACVFFLHFNFQTIQTRNILTHFLECWTSKNGPSSEHSCFLALVASKSVKHESFGHF